VPINIACPKCFKGGAVPDEYAGKKVKCPACKTPFQVFSPNPESKTVAAAATVEQATRLASDRKKPLTARDYIVLLGVGGALIGVIFLLGALLGWKWIIAIFKAAIQIFH